MKLRISSCHSLVRQLGAGDRSLCVCVNLLYLAHLLSQENDARKHDRRWYLAVEGDELESGVRVAYYGRYDDGARDDDNINHGCCSLKRCVVALQNDCCKELYGAFQRKREPRDLE